MTKKEKEGEINIYTIKKLLSFSSKVNNNKKTKSLSCNCWVCEILNSVKETEADTLRYEDYNIVSETGDSIFYDPLISNSVFNNEDEEEKLKEGQIYIAEDRILDFVQDKLLAKQTNGVNFK
jgi:hypothetical protein